MSEMSEAEAGMELAVGACKKLHEKCPDHELLDLFTKTDQANYDDEVWEGFQVRFGKEGISKAQRSCEPAQAFFWAKYFLALKEACKEHGVEV